MKRGAEFTLFAVFAVAIHLIFMLLLHTGAPLAAGGPVSSGNPIAAAGDLSDLIDSWEDQPETAKTEELETTEVVDDLTEQPEEMTEAETFDVSALTQPQVSVTPPQAVVQPQITTPTPPTPAVPVPTVPNDPQPVTADTQVDLPELNLLQAPSAEPLPLPDQTLVKPRETEPDPDPNKRVEPLDRLELVRPEEEPELAPRHEPELAMNVQQPLPQPVALPQPTAPTIPEPEPEPEVKDSEAPLVAAMPKAKPKPPEVQKPRKTSTKKKPAKKKPAKKKPDAPRKVAKKPSKPAGGGGSATNTTQTNQGGDGTRTAALTPGAGGVAKDGGFSKAAVHSARKAFAQAVGRAVARKKKYPKRAQRRGLTGRAMLKVTVSASGQLIGVRLAKSTGESTLDEAALKAARRVSKYPRIPKEMGGSQATVTIPLRFQVN